LESTPATPFNQFGHANALAGPETKFVSVNNDTCTRSPTWMRAEAGQVRGPDSRGCGFESPPPCHAFWSPTMYDTPDFFLVENPIERYSIGDRTHGLVRRDDGSLTIVMQHDDPAEPERRANWLPTPAGAFRPILRMYEPESAVFDGSCELPPITRS
jgi:hypothetical protein